MGHEISKRSPLGIPGSPAPGVVGVFLGTKGLKVAKKYKSKAGISLGPKIGVKTGKLWTVPPLNGLPKKAGISLVAKIGVKIGKLLTSPIVPIALPKKAGISLSPTVIVVVIR